MTHIRAGLPAAVVSIQRFRSTSATLTGLAGHDPLAAFAGEGMEVAPGRGVVGWRCPVKRGQFGWWEEASIALGMWLLALVSLWPRREPRTPPRR